MSFGEKIAAIMQRPGQDPQPKDDVPWYLKYGGRILGTFAGFVAIFFGIMTAVQILFVQVICFLGGLWQIIAGFLVITIEAPCCCMFIDFVQNFSNWVDSRPYWNRAAAYCGLAIPAVFLCPGMSTVLGSGLIFATGVVYGMMSIGKKGSGLDAAGLPTTSVGSPQEPMPPGTHHTTLMEDPDVWRPT